MEKMKTMKSYSIFPAPALRGAAILLLGVAPLAAGAQLHEQINVEGKYVPEVIRVDRINTFPKAMEFTLPTTPLSYETKGVAAGFTPSLMSMPATGWRADRTFADNRGYVELGVGSWLNSTLSAGYRFIDNGSTLLGARFQHNSTTLWKPKLSEATADVKQWRYDESLGIYASHIFKGAGRLDAAIDYHIGAFDYFGWTPSFTSPQREEESLKAPTQTLNDLSLRLDWRSALRPSASFAYNATLRLRHFAMRSLPLPALWDTAPAKGNRETDLGISAGIRLPWDNGSQIGLDACLDVLFYGGDSRVFSFSPAPGHVGYSLSKPGNYALATLTPYYRFTHGLLDVKLGADIDLAYHAGPEGSRYSFFHVAPEVKFALQTGQVGIYLNAVGGSELNTLAALYERDYYMMPALTSTRPTYTPLDASFGVNLGPFAGFSLGVEGRFRTSRNVRLGGWYMAWTDWGGLPMPGIDMTQQGHRMLYSLDSDGIDMHGFSVGARMSYEPSKRLCLTARGDYQPQEGKKGFFNGYDRPRVTARFEASGRPVERLRIGLAYDYRGVRRIYTRSVADFPAGGVTTGGPEYALQSMRLPDLCLLNLSASWDFTPDFSVWLQADNLLNRHDALLPMQPTQGLTLAGGLKWLF